MSAAPLFLNVDRSVAGRVWRARLDAAGEARALAIAQTLGCGELTARILVGRGVASDAAEAFLNPTLRALMPDPLTLRDMDAAVDRLARALEQGEQIAIFGDYDVDGATSAALLSEFLTAAGAPAPFVHIPDRITEGYGPNIEAIDQLRARGASVLVTVDCGTTSHEALAHALAAGLDAIALDHHQAPELLPPGVIVNPNRQDDLSGLGHLCAAGVSFLALVGLWRELRRRDYWTEARPEPDLMRGLDLVALGTVADVASLQGLNRAFVTRGLEVMRQRRRAGLSALMDAARMDGPPRPWHLGFALGPRINAGGRIGDAALGARLLTEGDPIEAARIARELDRLNGERQALEAATLELAEAEAETQLRHANRVNCLVVAGDDWHPGVVGLIASRLKEKFKKPSFAFAFIGQKGTGSGRSLTCVDLGRAVRRAAETGVIDKGGGHAMAAGASLSRDRLDAFRDYMNDALEKEMEAVGCSDALTIDAALTARGATPELIAGLERAGPFGQGNPEPLFALPDHVLQDSAPVGSGPVPAHVRARLRAPCGATLSAVAFRCAGTPLGDALLRGRGERFHAAIRLTLNSFRGQARVEARIVDLARPQG